MILETQSVLVQSAPKPLCEGHIQIHPKIAIETLQECEPHLIVEMFTVASRVASMLFDSQLAQGTNIILSQQPVRIDIVARNEKDGFKLQWEPKQGDMDQIKNTASDIAARVIIAEKPAVQSQSKSEAQVISQEPVVEKKEESAKNEDVEEVDEKLWMRHRLP